MTSNLRPAAGDMHEPFDDDVDDGAGFQARASAAGREFKFIAAEFLTVARAKIIARNQRHGPYPVDFVIEGRNGHRFVVLAHGVIDDTNTAGLRRTDTVKKLGFDAIQLARRQACPVLAIVSHLPNPGTPADYLADLRDDLFDVIATTGDLAGYQRLARHLTGVPVAPTNAPWQTTRPDQLDLFTGAPNPDDATPTGAFPPLRLVDTVDRLDFEERF